MQEVRITRQLSSQLPETGALLSELLSRQEFISQQHERAASRAVPLAEAEKVLQATVQNIAQETEQLSVSLTGHGAPGGVGLSSGVLEFERLAWLDPDCEADSKKLGLLLMAWAWSKSDLNFDSDFEASLPEL